MKIIQIIRNSAFYGAFYVLTENGEIYAVEPDPKDKLTWSDIKNTEDLVYKWTLIKDDRKI